MDAFIKWSAVVIVAGLAGVAGWVSFTHVLDVALLYGQPRPAVYAYPATVDGFIYVPGMFLLNHARRKQERDGSFWYAWGLVGLGAVVTGFANAWAGLPHGAPGAIVSAWPAVALVLSYEMLMLLIRGMAEERPGTQVVKGVPSIRQIKTQLHVGYDKAKEHQDSLMNGART